MINGHLIFQQCRSGFQVRRAMSGVRLSISTTPVLRFLPPAIDTYGQHDRMSSQYAYHPSVFNDNGKTN